MTESKGKSRVVDVPTRPAGPSFTVEPLNQRTYEYAIEVINKAPMVGKDAENILVLKQELARVAGLSLRPKV